MLLLLSTLSVLLAVAVHVAVTPGPQQSPGTSGCDDSTTQPAAEYHNGTAAAAMRMCEVFDKRGAFVL